MRAETERTRALVVEDDPSLIRLLREILEETSDPAFEVETAGTVAELARRVASGSFDVLLLDLNLPDSAGLDTFLRARALVPDLPIVALTALDDEALARQLIQGGAQDYLVKGNVGNDLLVRSIRYAVERKRAERRLLWQEEQLRRAELEKAEVQRQLEQRERDLEAIERLVRDPPTSETARTYGTLPLREAVPEVFEDLVQQYHRLLALAFEERTHKVEHRVTERLRAIADRLGFLRAGPRDAVEIHRAALRAVLSDSGGKSQARVETARWILVELLGYLVSYYRTYYVGARRPGMTP